MFHLIEEMTINLATITLEEDLKKRLAINSSSKVMKIVDLMKEVEEVQDVNQEDQERQR